MSKRYVLLFADEDILEADFKALSELVEHVDVRAKLISVDGNKRAVIVKTTNTHAPSLRELRKLEIGGKELRAVLTSGSIGKLKSRASESRGTANGQVPER